jgi:hypothetical protein
MKKLLFWLLTSIVISINILSGVIVYAQDAATLEIVPKSEQDLWTINQNIQEWTWNVRTKYNEQAKTLSVWDQIASWVMTRDTILNYGVVLLKFLSQAGILIGALMFIYTWYQYVMSVITGDWTPWNKNIKQAIYGILIIIFSYAIMRILTRAFLT